MADSLVEAEFEANRFQSASGEPVIELETSEAAVGSDQSQGRGLLGFAKLHTLSS